LLELIILGHKELRHKPGAVLFELTATWQNYSLVRDK